MDIRSEETDSLIGGLFVIGFGREDEDNCEVGNDHTIIFHVPRPCVIVYSE